MATQHPRKWKREKKCEFRPETQKRVGNGCREARRYGSKRNEVVKTNVLAPDEVAFTPPRLTAAIPIRGGWADCVNAKKRLNRFPDSFFSAFGFGF